MIDFTQPMFQDYEYYIVDTSTWKDRERLLLATSADITRDSSKDTLETVSLNVDSSLDQEVYIRIYLVATQKQNGIKVTEKYPLATTMIQTSRVVIDETDPIVPADGYSPLLEMKDGKPPIGYTLQEGMNILAAGKRLCFENLRCPVISNSSSDKTLKKHFTANVNDDYLVFVKDLLASDEYELKLDEYGKVYISKIVPFEKKESIHTYTIDNSSIVQNRIEIERDLYGIPNVVEVVYSQGEEYKFKRIENRDPKSPSSIVNRGREVLYRDSNPSFVGVPRDHEIDEYAKKLLKDLSSLEHIITYTHGYIPNVKLGSCVTLNYPEYGIHNIKATVISQSIKCETGCMVTEKAVFSINLWG